MRANDAATTTLTPATLMATGACSRELPQPKFSLGDDDVARLHAVHEVGVDVLHRVARELLRVVGVEVAGRDDDVGVDVAAVLVDGALEDHREPPFTAPTSSGVAMWPASAEAAATYGLAR